MDLWKKITGFHQSKSQVFLQSTRSLMGCWSSPTAPMAPCHTEWLPHTRYDLRSGHVKLENHHWHNARLPQNPSDKAMSESLKKSARNCQKLVWKPGIPQHCNFDRYDWWSMAGFDEYQGVPYFQKKPNGCGSAAFCSSNRLHMDVHTPKNIVYYSNPLPTPKTRMYF